MLWYFFSESTTRTSGTVFHPYEVGRWSASAIRWDVAGVVDGEVGGTVGAPAGAGSGFTGAGCAGGSFRSSVLISPPSTGTWTSADESLNSVFTSPGRELINNNRPTTRAALPAMAKIQAGTRRRRRRVERRTR